METIDLDGEEASDGLLSLVITVVELLVEAMEGEALRRMESGALTDEEIERLGQQLAEINEEIEELKADNELEDDVSQLRTSLSEVVEDAVRSVDEDSHPGFAFLDDVNEPSPDQPADTSAASADTSAPSTPRPRESVDQSAPDAAERRSEDPE